MIRKYFIYVIIGAYLIGGGALLPSSTTITADQTGNTESYILGDVDGDGKVSTEDTRLILRASMGLEDLSKNKAMFERADYNGDGKITIADARATLRASVDLEPKVVVASQQPEEPPQPDPDGRGLGEIPDDELSKVITSIATPFGAIAVFSDDRVAICKSKKIMHCWDEETTENDILFDANTICSNPARRWYGVVNDRIFYFTNESMALAVDDVYYYNYTGSEWFCYCVTNNALDVWSPGAVARVARRVTDSLFYCGYLFYEIDGDYVYVMNADPYRIAKMPQEYVDAHPLKSKILGSAIMIDYARNYLGSDPDVIDYGKRETFNRQFGVDWSIWGHPKNSIDVNDLTSYWDESYNDVYASFDIPSEKTDSTMRFEHIAFNGNDGYFELSYENGSADFAKWTSYNSSKNIYDGMLAYLTTFGSDGEVRYPKQGHIEQGVDIRGLTMFAGYDSNADSQSVYVLVEYQ